jgi:hypothetical protein
MNRACKQTKSIFFFTSDVCQFLHVKLEKPFEALRVFVQIFDLFSKVEIFAGQTLDLVLQTGLGIVGRRFVDRLKKMKTS